MLVWLLQDLVRQLLVGNTVSIGMVAIDTRVTVG